MVEKPSNTEIAQVGRVFPLSERVNSTHSSPPYTAILLRLNIVTIVLYPFCRLGSETSDRVFGRRGAPDALRGVCSAHALHRHHDFSVHILFHSNHHHGIHNFYRLLRENREASQSRFACLWVHAKRLVLIRL